MGVGLLGFTVGAMAGWAFAGRAGLWILGATFLVWLVLLLWSCLDVSAHAERDG